MSYSEAVDQLSKSDAVTLNKIIEEWVGQSHGGTQVANLKNEIFLTSSAFDALLPTIITKAGAAKQKNGKLSAKKMLRAVSEKPLYRKGGFLTKNKKRHIPRFIGTIMPERRLLSHLIDNYEGEFLFNDKRTSEKLRKIVKDNTQYKYKNVYIREETQYSLWFTWNNENTNDTLRFLSTWAAERARVELGLGHDNYDNKDLVALIFKNPEFTDFWSKSLYRPTCFDSGFNVYFRPTTLPKTDPNKREYDRNSIKGHGLTFSLSKNNHFKLRLGNFEGNRPEAVAQVIDYPLSSLHQIYFLERGRKLHAR